jgi:hypothetical protein
MPNGIAVTERPSANGWPALGTPVRLVAGLLEAGERSVTWPADRPPLWDPTLRVPAATSVASVHARASALLASRGIAGTDPETLAEAFASGGVEIAADAAARRGIALLLRSVAERDAELAGRGAGLLVGRGPGLTPEGDDVVAGVGAVVWALSAQAGWKAAAIAGWLEAVRTPDLRRRTAALSATLLELALAGQVFEPVHGLLDMTVAGEHPWRGALHRLERIGHSTGPTYAAAIGAAGLLVGA